MRLFVAILFNENMKDELTVLIENLKHHTVRGNLHLTLEFIGETVNYKAASKALKMINECEFKLKIGGLGCFNRDGGKICWVGVQQSSELMELQRKVHIALRNEGFKLENRAYKPHITLGREVILENGYNLASLESDLPEISMSVKKISLMKSERIAGKLVYTEMDSVRLTE